MDTGTKHFLLTILLLTALFIAGCGGDGNDDGFPQSGSSGTPATEDSGTGSNTGSESGPGGSSDGMGEDNAQPEIMFSPASAPFDPIQACFNDDIATVLPANLPLLGDSAGELLTALNSLLDVPDIIWLGLENFMITQDSQDLIDAGSLINNRLQTFANELMAAVVQLTDVDNLFAGTPVEVITLRSQLSNLLIQLQSGLVSAMSTGDLSVLTTLLNDISTSLTDVATLVPGAVQDGPEITALLTSLADSVAATRDILTSTSTLDALAFQTGYDDILNSVSINIVGMLPLDADVTNDLADKLIDVNDTIDNGFGVLSAPLFNALEQVLTPNTTPSEPLAAILGGVIGNDLAEIGGTTLLAQLLQGGTNGAPLLSDQLSGLPLLGDLLGALAGTDIGGLTLITEILDGNVTDINDMVVTIGSLIAHFPGLGGGADGLPLLLVTDLVNGMLSLVTADESVIESSLGSFLNNGDGGGTTFDLMAIAAAIQGDPVLGGILAGLGPLCTLLPLQCL